MPKAPQEDSEYRHLHNSGVEKRIIFSSQEDFDRFEAYLYLLNSVESPRAANFFTGNRAAGIFEAGRGDNLVAIGAYSFLPQQFDIMVKPLREGGVGKFMQKLQTAYTMYFNKKYMREGRLFNSAYRSRSLATDDDIKHTYAYIHLNPASMFDQRWETLQGSELAILANRALQYRYSSAGEYVGSKFIITSPTYFPQYLKRTKDARAHFALWTRYKEKHIVWQ